MGKNYSIKQGSPYPLGAVVCADGINFAAALDPKKEGGVILYPKTAGRAAKTHAQIKIPFQKEGRTGNVACMRVAGISPQDYAYNFYEGSAVVTDAYARRIFGMGAWNVRRPDDEDAIRAGFVQEGYDWQGDCQPDIPYEDSILYCIHVRGFTKHASSKVKHRGHFAGVAEKIPYLKELGVTALELMPAYEFDEVEKAAPASLQTAYMKERYKDIAVPKEEEQAKINYWGFKGAYYFAPKSAYAHGDPAVEFKDMVRLLHAAGIEVIMQFYFPDTVRQGYMLDVLRYWVLEYHIDGIHLKGSSLPVELLADDPLFSRTKILYHSMPVKPAYKNFALYQDDFMYEMRKLLKGDEDKIRSLLYHIRRGGTQTGVINYMTNYYGFTLMDLVSYDRKHNEANGEDGRDGADCNVSWNCGAEGKSRKPSILKLRKRQMKNAYLLLLLSQGTPLLLSGDEFGNSQNGNNNPYCQDNETTWLNWNLLKTNGELFAFVKEAVALRKAHAILHTGKAFLQSDHAGCGFPDISFHGKEAWQVDTGVYSRQAGVMYCENYAPDLSGAEGEKRLLYVAYNMHWQQGVLALPKLPKGMCWRKALDTAPADVASVETAESVKLPGRTIAVYAACQAQEEGNESVGTF